MLPKTWTAVKDVKRGGEREGFEPSMGLLPNRQFQLDPEEGSEGFQGSPEVRCRCFEES